MLNRYAERWLHKIPGLQEGGHAVATALHRAILAGGEPTRELADFFHGSWLGHPLHPLLTDLPIGAWSMALLMDGLAASGQEEAEWAADTLTLVGVLTAVPTAIAGAVDYSTIPKQASSAGALHATLNTISLTLYLLSLRERKGGNRPLGMLYSTVAFAVLGVSSWLGGEMVYKEQVGVNHGDAPRGPEQWQAVLDEGDLPDHVPQRVEVEGTPVLLYRHQGEIYAIGAVCSHAGGPLEEGTFRGHCVECPWHDSVFDLRDGSVVHGPSTFTQPRYATRIRAGQIEVRLLSPDKKKGHHH